MEAHKAYPLLSVLSVVLGVVLLVYMIVVEGEPGAIPVLLIAAGLGWFLALRTRRRAPHD